MNGIERNQRGGSNDKESVATKKRKINSNCYFISNGFFCVCFSRLRDGGSCQEVPLLSIETTTKIHRKIIPLKMKNESCVRCKNSDCALLFHY